MDMHGLGNPSYGRLLTTQEAAMRLGLTNSHTLAVWRSTKRYPQLIWIKVGRSVRYSEEDLQRFISERTVKSPKREDEQHV